MPAGGRPTVRSRRLGAALKRYRESVGLDQAAAAAAIMKSVTKVSRLEGGQVSASALEVRTLLDRYGVEDPHERTRLENLARASTQRGWWLEYQEALRSDYADHITLETDATRVRSWEPSLIPGLLQTRRYAESVIAHGPAVLSPERTAALVEVRMERQRRLSDGGLDLTAVVWEPAVTALLDHATAGAEQLERLLDAGQQQNITVQLLPASASRTAGMSGPFVAFSFGAEPDVEAVTVRNAATTMVVERPEDLALYANVFNRLRSAALSPEESARRIRRILKEANRDA
ncbi:DUF5753 domain-containing protein [Streptomyces sp. TRM64462]|uniref:DUF5753 domain-containing protein n=1 Tax=Streptomyces sp. TRM64462 TaxID=2741726 RepID=UPI001585DA05|nr:DUF5753 domain-containing protein [Streptomyces sp. TRM64462]